MKYFKNKKLIIVISSVIILVSLLVIINDNKENKDLINTNLLALNEEISSNNNEEESFYVDIKGSVKNPGVYLINKGEIVNDLIKKAGGLIKNASTKNINLSKELSKEMIIYVYSNKELDRTNVEDNIKECLCEEIECTPCIERECSIIVSDNNEENNITQDTSNIKENSNIIGKDDNKISINNASLEELMSLTGIGESKANAIIEYRTVNNGFNAIDELLKVSGIGDSIFDKIKENITL